jgi:hypothetical protein
MLVNQILGNWQVGSSIRLSSGMPLYKVVWEYYSNPLSAYGFPGPELPNLVGDPKPSNQNADHWIDGSAFAPRISPWAMCLST